MDDLKQLFMKYRLKIYKYLYYLSGDKFVAEDLTQETFYRAFNSIHRFKGQSKVSTWLFQIAKYTFYGYLKKNEKSEYLTDMTEFENKYSDVETPEKIYIKKDEAAQIRNAIKKLNQQQQEVLILRLYNGLSFKEIGEIFCQSDTWARVNFYRAKNKLASIITGDDEV